MGKGKGKGKGKKSAPLGVGRGRGRRWKLDPRNPAASSKTDCGSLWRLPPPI